MQSKTPRPAAAPPTEAERMAQGFARRFDELRQTLSGRDPQQIAAHSAAQWQSGRFQITLLGRAMSVTHPGFEVLRGDGETPAGQSPASLLDTAFLLYYLATADGAALEGRWIAFSELPDGRFYNSAFQGYTGAALARAFGEDAAAFEQAARKIGGRALALGDAAFTFDALPRLPVSVVLWRGDEDFPSTYQLLFDAAAPHYLPTDACAVLGSALTRMLIKEKP